MIKRLFLSGIMEIDNILMTLQTHCPMWAETITAVTYHLFN